MIRSSANDLYASLRALWPQLPDPNVVTAYEIRGRAGDVAVLGVEVTAFIDGDIATAFREYELRRKGAP